MPARNTAPYIAESVDSVLRQTWRALELLVVDDGSQDGTPRIVADIARRDPRVRLLAGKGEGASGARNLAIAHARGTLLALLDSDDVWDESFLEREVGVLQRYPEAGIVSGNAVNLGGPHDGTPLLDPDRGLRRLTLAEILSDEQAVCIMSVFRREIVERIGGFDPRFNVNEDYEFWIRAALAGIIVMRDAEPLGHYRRRSDSMSANELRTVSGILRVFEAARVWCRELPAELAIVERQVQRFERELLAIEAKTALRRRDYSTAATRFRALYVKDPTMSSAILAAASHLVPGPMAWLDRQRQARRSRRARRSIVS